MELTDEDVGAEVDDLEAEEREGGEGRMGEVRRVMGDLIDELVCLCPTHSSCNQHTGS